MWKMEVGREAHFTLHLLFDGQLLVAFEDAGCITNVSKDIRKHL